MFDFRQGGSTQKLLADKKRGSKRMAGNGSFGNKLDKPTCSCKSSLEIIDGEDGLVKSEIGRPSVEKFIEDQTFTKKDMNDDEKMQKTYDSEREGPSKKNHKKETKTCAKSHENICLLVASDQVEIDGRKDSDHQSASSLQEFTSCTKNDQPNEVHLKLDETNDDDYEEKLNELIKRLITERDGEIQNYMDSLEAFHVLGSSEETFLKTSHEPGVPLLGDPQSLGSSQRMKEEDCKTVEGSVVSKEKVSAVEQSDALVRHEKRKFFSRKVKSQEKSSSVQSDSSKVLKTIVILKPRLKSVDIGSSSEPHSMSNKAKNGTIGSYSLLNGIKRRLKFATRKELYDVPKDNIPNVLSGTRQTYEQEEKKENLGKNVSDKEPFCNERTSGASTSKVNGEENHASENSKKNASRIYVEAKKHLHEMLTNGDTDVNLSSNEVPRILGRILSFPEFSSPVGSPRRTQEHHVINFNNNEREHHPSPLSQTSEKPKTQQCSSDDYSEPPKLESSDLVDEDPDKLDEALFTSNVGILRGVLDSAKEAETMDEEDSTVLDPLSGPCSSSNLQNVTDVDDDTLETHDEEGDKKLWEQFQETFDEDQTPPSLLESPPNSSVQMIECQESANDIPGKSSPVSVLEPPFTEDDISPTSTRSSFVEIRVQPLCINFDEPDSPDADHNSYAKTTMDDKESTLAYIKAVVKASSLNWDEIYAKSFPSDQLLELPLMDGIQFCSSQLRDDEKLLFDCINEVLMEFCGHEFGSGPWISSVKPSVRLISNVENAVKEVQEGVYWHLVPLPFPRTLDQIVRKDMVKTGNWMDLRLDINHIGIDTGDLIFDELLEEIIRNCINVSQDLRDSLVPVEQKQDETSEQHQPVKITETLCKC